jgi:hypothetical protein
MAEENENVQSLSEMLSAEYDKMESSSQTDEQDASDEKDADTAAVNEVSLAERDGLHQENTDQETEIHQHDKTVESPDGQQQQENSLSPPIHWSAADKEAFQKSPPEVQEWALRRDKQINADYTRKTQEIANFRKTWEPINEMLAPYAAQGVNPTALIQQWAGIAQQLQQNPAETLRSLAQQYRVDLGAPQQQPQDDLYQDPQVAQLKQTIEQLQQQQMGITNAIQSREQYEQQSRQQAMEAQIAAFSEQKNENGELSNPYFNDVITDMMQLAQIERQSGRQPSLQDLYDRAIWSNPTVREKVLAAQQSAAAKKAEQEAIDKAKRAQRAAKTVSGSNTGEPSKQLSIRESLEQNF